jgi:hypothetical protein
MAYKGLTKGLITEQWSIATLAKKFKAVFCISVCLCISKLQRRKLLLIQR